MIDAYTPGPWLVSSPDPDVPSVVHGRDGIPICRMGGAVTQINVPGNAVLIAAAPDMLAALRLLDNGYKHSTEVCNIARAAIAKAEGRS